MKHLIIGIVFCTLAGGIQISARDILLPHTPSPTYALIMTNGSQIPVSEYSIDLEKETITYRSQNTDFVATFPLERIKKVVRYSRSKGNMVESKAVAVYMNDSSVSDLPDDGGVPVTFRVKHVSVGSRGRTYVGRTSTGTKRFTSAGRGRSTTTSRSTYGRTSNRSTSTSSGSSRVIPSFSSSRRSSGSSSRYSSSRSFNTPSHPNSSAEDFFSALFGGNR